MRVIGVDPGLVVTGFGIIDKKDNDITDEHLIAFRISK